MIINAKVAIAKDHKGIKENNEALNLDTEKDTIVRKPIKESNRARNMDTEKYTNVRKVIEESNLAKYIAAKKDAHVQMAIKDSNKTQNLDTEKYVAVQNKNKANNSAKKLGTEVLSEPPAGTTTEPTPETTISEVIDNVQQAIGEINRNLDNLKE